MDLFRQIIHADYRLFERINEQWTNDWFDHFFVFIRQAVVWAPLYLFLLLFVVLNFKRRGWWWAGFFLVSVAITETLSSHIIKDAVGRTRPCLDPLLADGIRFLANYCPHSGSFTSSHAANHFGMATFIASTLGRQSRYWWWAYGWAFCISYAQVYVGVHFPLDVLGGAVLGVMAGLLSARLFHRRAGALLFINPNLA
jgi:membrane-associated phospholipid phosphatase